jgi:transcriptional regulator with XRE-family HTH domain
MITESGDQTIRRVLSAYQLGPKLRHLRLRKKIGLKELSAHTGLSASLLSQLENGKLVPTLPTLVRIAMVFDVSLDHFFGDRPPKRMFALVRASERIRFPDRPGAQAPAYFFECLAYPAQGKAMEAYLAEFPRRPDKERREHMHEGYEFLFVVEGELLLRRRDEGHTLGAGDSVYFDSSEPHCYGGLSDPPARAVVVTLPPRTS